MHIVVQYALRRSYYVLLTRSALIPFVSCLSSLTSSSFFSNDTATTEFYTLSLHDALPISTCAAEPVCVVATTADNETPSLFVPVIVSPFVNDRSEEHTSELQSRLHLVCRLLLEKKKKTRK